MLGDSASKTIFFHKMNLTESYLRSDADFLAGQEKSNLWQFLSPLSIHSLSFFQLTFYRFVSKAETLFPKQSFIHTLALDCGGV